jgi:NNP family nitrate/nitrite transporter-like MFS transporter
MAKESIQFEVPVDDVNKCTEFKPFKMWGPIPVPHCGKRKKTNPHMRAFWAATLAFMLAFIGWFAFAPLMTVVRKDIGICDNNAAVQLDIENVKCICKKECKKTLGDAKIASVSFDIVTRFLLGSVIEVLGPKNTDCLLLSLGALFCACGVFVTNGTSLIIVRFFVSCLGSTFVVNQFWNTIMFNRSVVGTANATAGGWGNLGGGLTQTLMPLLYTLFHDGFSLKLGLSWRCAILVPPVIYIILVTWIFFCSQDTTTGKFDIAILGKTSKAGPMTYLMCLGDYRVFLMIFQYSACFGCELVMNNSLSTQFQDYFGVDIVAAGFLAMSFGGMNLFARSLGGILSDYMNAKDAMRGRLWAHFISLFGQAVFLFLFGCVTSDLGWGVALAVLIVFAIFVNMAEGTSYGIVPYMIPQEVAVVSAMVGAGGTLGAVIATWSFYKYIEDDLLPFKLHACYVMFWALSCFLMRWETMGSMFSKGTLDETVKKTDFCRASVMNGGKTESAVETRPPVETSPPAEKMQGSTPQEDQI